MSALAPTVLQEPGAGHVLPWEWGVALMLGFGLAWIALGVLWGRKAKSMDDFTVAGRNVGLGMGTATAAATWITSNTVVLAPVFALKWGIGGMLAYSSACLGLLFFAPMAQRIRKLMPRGYTAVQFMRMRFGKDAGMLFLCISLLYGFAWLVTMAMAGGVVLEALSGVPYIWGVGVVVSVCVLYTLFGGMYAVIGTDSIQSLIVLVGIVLVAVFVLREVPIAEIHGTLAERRPALLSWVLPVTLMAFFNNLLFGFGEVFHSNVWWCRALAMRDGVGPKAYALAALVWLPVPIVAGFLGLAAPALDVPVANPSAVGPLVAAHMLGTFGGVLVFVVVFCSIASSIDSLLAATSDLLIHDVSALREKARKPPSEAQLRWRMRLSIILLGLGAFLVSAPHWANLEEILFLSGGLVGSAIPPILAGLFGKRLNGQGAVLAMFFGSTVGVIVWFHHWYLGALVGTAVSGLLVLLWQRFDPSEFSGLPDPAQETA